MSDADETESCSRHPFCDETADLVVPAPDGTDYPICRDCYESDCGRCLGPIEKDENVAKGLCQNCRDEILMWGGDETRGIEKEHDNEQTKLLTDGGQSTDETERDVPSRVRSFHATVLKAVENAEETSSWSRRFSSSDVQRLEADLPDRTLRRAMKDAEALGWIDKKRQKWTPGELAEEIAPDPEPTPNGTVGRASSDDAWHLLTSGNKTMCGTNLNIYANGLEAERERIGHMADDDIDVLAVDLCNDCLGF